MAKSTTSTAVCPLWKHPNGQWCKKVRRKVYYFGVDQATAVASWNDVGADLLAGRKPQAWQAPGYTLKDLANDFLEAKQAEVARGELSHPVFCGYKILCDEIRDTIGLGRLVESLDPDDFAKLKCAICDAKPSPNTQRLEIARTKAMLNWAVSQGKIERRPRVGADFGVDPRVIRRHRAAVGDLSFTADEIQQLLQAAREYRYPAAECWILLGINAAFTQVDIGVMKLKHIRGDIIKLPRSKTGIARECPLWPETLASLAKHFPFVVAGQLREAVSGAIKNVLDAADLKTPGRGFRGLRYTFETAAQEAVADMPAICRVMGHADHSMASVYNQRISTDRMRRVTDAVRGWLFGAKGGA